MNYVSKLALLTCLVSMVAGCSSLPGQAVDVGTCNPDALNTIFRKQVILERPGEFVTVSRVSMTVLPAGCSSDDITYVGDETTGGAWIYTSHLPAAKEGLRQLREIYAKEGWHVYTGY